MAAREVGWCSRKFLSRGFEISNVQIDGASVDAFNQQLFDPNLAMYDSVQVVRGANGLFSGNGSLAVPSIWCASVLRCKSRFWAQWASAAGIANRPSWILGPLNEAGSLRGRAVLAHS